VKLRASVAGQERDVELTLEGSRVSANVGGRRYDLEIGSIDGSNVVLFHGHSVFDCRVTGGDAGDYDVRVGSANYKLFLRDPKRLRASDLAGSHGEGSAQIVAPMPGKVVRVLVEAGAEVEAGQAIVVVEAMKMQNELKAPRAGKITSLTAAEGSAVTAGQLLAVIE
jgi:acetyl/propionyl-CoA carboxylase alpha subunit